MYIGYKKSEEYILPELKELLDQSLKLLVSLFPEYKRGRLALDPCLRPAVKNVESKRVASASVNLPITEDEKDTSSQSPLKGSGTLLE